MPKLIAAMNMTLDGYCDHTSMVADEEIHEHYTELLKGAEAIIYGRVTYQLMEYWRSIVENPTGERTMDEFAAAIDEVTKIVYSRTLNAVDWRNTELKRELVREDILDLKRNAARDIFVGSPGMIVALANLGLVDEFQIAVQPTIINSGMRLFEKIEKRIDLELLKTKPFGCGAMVLYYRPAER